MKRNLTILFSLFLCFNTAFAQINDGGSQPKSFELNIGNPNFLPQVLMPGLDVAAVAAEDDAKAAKDGTFMRTGRLIDMDIDLQTHGNWTNLPNGDRIWRVFIQSQGALAMNVYFDKYWLPEGAKLHVYSPDKKQVLGGYTSFNNHSSGLFATELIHDDALVVEYYEPYLARGTGQLKIGQVGHTYRTGGFGSSDPCQVNVNCSPEGDNKAEQRDAVARILVTVQAGQGWCSGAMVNNTNNDCTPYFLTAMHCGTDGANLTSAANFNQWVFYFNYQSNTCSNGTKPPANTITGASVISHSNDGGGNSGSDFLLLELNNEPLTAWNVFYAGWNRTTSPSTSGYGIHHPSGDIKKISTYTSTLVSTQWGSAAGSHWQVVWAATANGNGVTEGGSSGSPIFNANGEVVGTLTGGSSFCTSPTSPDLYGKFSYHWDQNGAANNRRLEPWLDPTNSGVTSFAGVYHPCNVATNPDDAGISAVINPPDNQTFCDDPFTPEVTIRNYGTNTLTTATINYRIDAGPIQTFNWTGSLVTNASENVTLSPMTAPGPGVAFNFISYTTSPNGQTDPDNSNDTTTVTSQLALAQALPYSEDFEAGGIPTDITIIDPDADNFVWDHTTAASAYGVGTGSMWYDNYGGTGGNNPGGTVDWMILPTFDLTSSTSTAMRFDYAYARYSAGNSDTLVIAVDDDCDGLYQAIYYDGGSNIATAPDNTSAFTPTAAQWDSINLDLSVYDGLSHVSIAFINLSGWGNNLYIDNINVTTASGCAITLTPSGVTDVSCNGGTDGAATVTPSGGTPPYTYSWNDPLSQTTATATNLPAGTWTVTVTDAAACVETLIITISEPTALTANVSNLVDVSCNGAADGSFTVNASGGTPPYTYDAGSGPQGTGNFTNMAAGTYSITVTDANGCTTTTSATVNEPTALSASSSFTDETCGNANGTATVTVSGGTPGYTYLWTPGSQTTASVSGLSAGSYSCTITDANGCTSVENVVISNIAGPSASISASTDVSCNGGSDGTATVTATGGTPAYSYLWNDAGAQTTATATGLPAGSYMVTVTDGNGCATTASVTITEPTALASTGSSTNANCGSSDGSATATASGGTAPYTYLWDDPGTQTTSTATGLAAGSYNCTITDANGCTTVQNVVVNNNGGPTVSATSTDVSCNGGSDGTATANATGGTGTYTYLWDDTGAQTTQTATGLSAGTYTVIVTDGNGCSNSASVTISEPTVVTGTTTATDATCGNADGTASVNATGGTPGYTYLWDDPGAQTTATATGLAAGTYTVTITDANGCTATATATVNNAGAPTVTVTSTDVSCNGDSDGTATATATGGTPPYTYLWDDAGAQTTATATGLPAGTYSVTVTDGNGCAAVASVTITEPAPLSITVDLVTNPSSGTATDGAIDVTVSGGTMPYTYSWTGGATTEDLSNVGVGSYTLTVTDANGCTVDTTISLVFVGIGEIEGLMDLFIAPNPSSGQFLLNVAFANPTNIQVAVYNSIGQVITVMNMTTQQASIPIDITHHANGTYLVTLQSGDQRITRRIQKID